MTVLGTDDAQLSETMYDILHDVMKRADMGINVGYAVMYECVRTVTSIYPNVALLDAAATSISRFITSDNHNLKYLGIKSLAAIVQINSKYARAYLSVPAYLSLPAPCLPVRLPIACLSVCAHLRAYPPLLACVSNESVPLPECVSQSACPRVRVPECVSQSVCLRVCSSLVCS